jgi:sigma-B regulation protein RsbU (phosphoserine phosphatase)
VDEGLEAARLIERLNVQVAKHSPASRFITFFYGLYDPRTGVLQFVNAGHLPPVLLRANGQFDRTVAGSPGGLALGMFDHATYQTSQLTIEPGDVLVLYSDGITEAENPEGKAFEEAGLEAVLTRVSSGDPNEIGAAILASVEIYAADARLADDLTTLVVKRASPPTTQGA